MKYACTGQKEGKVLIYWIEVKNWGGEIIENILKYLFLKGMGIGSKELTRFPKFKGL